MKKSLMTLCQTRLNGLTRSRLLPPTNVGQIRPLNSAYHDLVSCHQLGSSKRSMLKSSAILRTGYSSALIGQTNIKCSGCTCGLSTASNEDPLLVDIKDQVLWLKFNRPKKFNAITLEMYHVLIDQLTKANSDPNIKVVVLTGVGKYYSSGNDLTNFLKMQAHPEGFKAGAQEGVNIFKRFIECLINLDKFAIAAVNGPCVGFTCTSLPLFDYVVCSDTATFYTPFTSLGQSPEGCSTVTFPKIMGTSRANELLLMNKIFKAEDAKLCGLVSDVIPSDNLYSTLDEMLYGKEGVINNCFPESLKKSKGLIRDTKHRQMLMEVNEAECKTLMGTWMGEEVQAALLKFFARSAKKE